VGPNRLRDQVEPNTSGGRAPVDTGNGVQVGRRSGGQSGCFAIALGLAIWAVGWFFDVWVWFAVEGGAFESGQPASPIWSLVIVGLLVAPPALAIWCARRVRSVANQATAGGVRGLALFPWLGVSPFAWLGDFFLIFGTGTAPAGSGAPPSPLWGIVIFALFVAGPVLGIAVSYLGPDQTGRTSATRGTAVTPPVAKASTRPTGKLLWGSGVVVAMLMFGALVAIPDLAVTSMNQASAGPAAASPAAGSTVDAGAWPGLSGVSSLPMLSDVTVGQCFSDVLASDDPTAVLGEQIVPCAQPHQDEMIGTATYPAAPGASFPAGTALDDFANHLCTGAFQEYVGIPADSSNLGWAYTTPSASTWSSDGDRWIGCWVESTPSGAPLVGSVRGSKQ
jgi:hypothetical protein